MILLFIYLFVFWASWPFEIARDAVAAHDGCLANTKQLLKSGGQTPVQVQTAHKVNGSLSPTDYGCISNRNSRHYPLLERTIVLRNVLHDVDNKT